MERATQNLVRAYTILAVLVLIAGACVALLVGDIGYAAFKGWREGSLRFFGQPNVVIIFETAWGASCLQPPGTDVKADYRGPWIWKLKDAEDHIKSSAEYMRTDVFTIVREGSLDFEQAMTICNR